MPLPYRKELLNQATAADTSHAYIPSTYGATPYSGAGNSRITLRARVHVFLFDVLIINLDVGHHYIPVIYSIYPIRRK